LARTRRVNCRKNLLRIRIIAVSGVGGAGKSTLANLVAKEINAPVIGVDSFMKDRTISGYSNWEIMDFARLEREVILPFLASANPLEYGHFDWSANKVIKTISVSHNGKIMIEGVGLFRPELNRRFAYKIWVDCPAETATERGKKRDRDEYQNPQDEHWDGIWKKNDEEYLAAFKPKETADFVFDNCA
jgi:uridine kinase